MSQGPDRLEVNQLKHHGKDFVVALCFFARRVKPMINKYIVFVWQQFYDIPSNMLQINEIE